MSAPYFDLFTMLDEYEEMGDGMCHPDTYMSHEDLPNILPSCNPSDGDGPDPDQLFLALMTSNVVIEETVMAMDDDVEDISATTTASNTTPAAIPIAATPLTADPITPAALKEDEVLITWGRKRKQNY